MKKIKVLFLTAVLVMMCAFVHAQSFDSMAIDYTNHVDYTPTQTSFFLCAPNKANHRPIIRLYREGLGGKPVRTIKMRRTENFGWTAVVKGDLNGMFYTFDVVGTKKNPVEMPGMFARAVGVNGKRGAIIDMETTNPAGWEQDICPALASPADLIIYEMHHRDFSIDPSSGLQHQGKFLALTEPKAINYLKELGINAVHILPSYDYASVDETRLDQPQYNWGYDPLNYNVPEGSYATDPYKPEVRIREFKQMVQTLHKAGIRVILDVVYNHTFDIEGSNFQRTFPDYFYRKKADGTYSDGTGCGNETASERPLMRQFMMASMKYWVEEYHIDGFRVDLMGVHDIETMNLLRAEMQRIDPSIFIYGEGWSAGQCAYPNEKLAMKANIRQMPGIAAFSDDLRDALRGPFSDDTKGAFLAGIPGEEESIKAGLAGMIAHPQVDYSKVNYSDEPYALEPTQMIAYVSCHDDMCLTDRLRASVPGITDDELIRLDLLAQTAVFTSQGVPFMLSGEEMLRNKKGVHNSYNSPDSVNHLDWNNLKRYPQVFAYYKGLIALRKQYPAFRMGSAEKVRRNLNFIATEPCLLAYRLYDEASRSYLYVVLNANKAAKRVEIPQGAYRVLCREGKIDVSGKEVLELTDADAHVQVAAQSALILRQAR
ncbi:MAG: type I pullulanase [Prevotella sp.]|jgi:pullulanase